MQYIRTPHFNLNLFAGQVLLGTQVPHFKSLLNTLEKSRKFTVLIWVMRSESLDAATYASTWIRHTEKDDPEEFARRFEKWMGIMRSSHYNMPSKTVLFWGP